VQSKRRTLGSYVLCLFSDDVSGKVVPSVLNGSQAIRNHFPGDPWIHFCNGYFEVHLCCLIKGIIFC
jgi:hypothetical protein